MKKLSVIMPVFNERPFLSRIVEGVLAVPLPAGLARELIIVDDGSSDGSAEVLANLATKHPMEIRLFRQEPNQGKGAAIARGIQEMTGDLVVFQDADLEYDPADFARLLEPIIGGHADVVYGSRFLGTEGRRVLNYHHALGNNLLTHLSNLTTGFNLTDMETCYKAFRADVLRTIPIRSRRFGIEPEITAKISKRNCVVYEVPIRYHGRTFAEGKKITWKDGIEALAVIAKYWVVDDCWSERYGHYVLQSLSGARRLSGWAVKTIEPYLGQSILEVGSGTANISRQLPKREHLTVSDRDEEYLRLLRLAFQNFDMVDVLRLDLASDEDFRRVKRRYDTVVCLNVLEHLEDDQAALRRMASVLQPGGRLILQVPQHPGLMGEMDRELGHFRRYNRRELLAKVESAGLEVEATKHFNALGILGWFLNVKLLHRREMSKIQLKSFDTLVPLLRRLESRLSLPGLALIAICRLPAR